MAYAPIEYTDEEDKDDFSTAQLMMDEPRARLIISLSIANGEALFKMCRCLLWSLLDCVKDYLEAEKCYDWNGKKPTTRYL